MHKSTRAQFAQHAAQRDSSSEEEEEEGDILQVIYKFKKQKTDFKIN